MLDNESNIMENHIKETGMLNIYEKCINNDFICHNIMNYGKFKLLYVIKIWIKKKKIIFYLLILIMKIIMLVIIILLIYLFKKENKKLNE